MTFPHTEMITHFTTGGKEQKETQLTIDQFILISLTVSFYKLRHLSVVSSFIQVTFRLVPV